MSFPMKLLPDSVFSLGRDNILDDLLLGCLFIHLFIFLNLNAKRPLFWKCGFITDMINFIGVNYCSTDR